MTEAALTSAQILDAVKRAKKGSEVTVRVRRSGEQDFSIFKGFIDKIDAGPSPTWFDFLLVPTVESGPKKAKVPNGQSDLEYLEISFPDSEFYADLLVLGSRQRLAGTNALGLIEYDPTTWSKVIRSLGEQGLPTMTDRVMEKFDLFFDTRARLMLTKPGEDPPEDEKVNHRETCIAFMVLCQRTDPNDAVYAMVWPALLRLCGIRRAKGAKPEVRTKILNRAFEIHNMTDRKERDKEWHKYNTSPPGSALN